MMYCKDKTMHYRLFVKKIYLCTNYMQQCETLKADLITGAEEREIATRKAGFYGNSLAATRGLGAVHA